MVKIDITDRAKKYGYVFWRKAQDEAMSSLLGKREAVGVVFMNAEHGKKKIDWRIPADFNRLALGERTSRNPNRVFVLKMSKQNKLVIQCQ